MIRGLSVALLLFAALPAHAVTMPEVQRAMAATTSMVAEFSQTAANGQVTRGTMQMKRPGKVRFDYAGARGKNAPYLVVADGRTLSFIDYQVSQVSQWPLRSTPLAVLLDPQADLAGVARVIPADATDKGRVTVLARDRKNPEQGEILFFLQPDSAVPGGLRLEGWTVTDAQTNRTTVKLSGARFNVPVADSAFRFRDPRVRVRPPGKTG